jgi:hypothetical protein
MEVKVITEKDLTRFQTEVNNFIGEISKIIQIQFSTTQFGEGEIVYTAFIMYQ